MGVRCRRLYAPHVRRLRTLLLLVALVLVTGCSGDRPEEDADLGDVASSEVTPSASEASEEPQALSRCDALVPPERVAELAGETLGDPSETLAGGLQVCEWSRRGHKLQVVDGPAAEWSPFLLADIEAVQSSGTPISAAQQRALKAGMERARTGDGVCSTVTTLAQVWSGGREADMVRLRLGPTTIRVDECDNGRFTRVLIDAGSVASDLDAALADVEALVRDIRTRA